MKLDKLMKTIARLFSGIGAIAILTILLVTVADVVMNKIFDAPFPGATEIITSAMPISVFGFLLSTQINQRHIAIDVVVERLRGKWQAILKSLAQGIGIYLFGLLTYLNVPMAVHSIRILDHTGGNIAVPIYPAKIIIPMATGLIAIQLFIEFCKSLHSVFIRPRMRETDRFRGLK